MFSRRSSLPQKPLSDWTQEEVSSWLTKQGFYYLTGFFKDHRINGEALCKATGRFLDEAEVPSAEERERLLTAVYELKALSPQKQPRSDTSNAERRSSFEVDSPVRLLGLTAEATSHWKRSPWKRSLSVTPEFGSGGRRTSLHASVTRRKSVQQSLQTTVTTAARGSLYSKRASFIAEDSFMFGMNSSVLAGQGSIKVYGGILRREIEYKTVAISPETTARELVEMALEKYDVTTRDPNLYYIAMEKARSNHDSRAQTVVLSDNEKPLVLQAACREPIVKFHLKARDGRLVKVYGSDISPGISYKSVYISEKTTASELARLMLKLYCSKTNCFSVYLCERSKTNGTERTVGGNEYPLTVMKSWKPSDGHEFHLLKKEIDDEDEDLVPRASATSLGDSGVEQDIHVARQEQFRTDSVTAMKGDDETNTITQAASYLSLTGMSVGSVDTFSPTFDADPDFEMHLQFSHRQDLEASYLGTDLVPKGHLEDGSLKTFVNLADLSKSRLRPESILNMEEVKEEGEEDLLSEKTETVKSESGNDDVREFLTAEERPADFLCKSILLPTTSRLYDILGDSQLIPVEVPTPDTSTENWGLQLSNIKGSTIRHSSRSSLGSMESDGSVSQRVHSRTSSDGLVGQLPFSPRASLSTEPRSQLESILYVKSLASGNAFDNLEEGDIIVEINGMYVLNLKAEDAIECLRNAEMSTLRFVVGRAHCSVFDESVQARVDLFKEKNAKLEAQIQEKSKEVSASHRLVHESSVVLNELKKDKEELAKQVNDMQQKLTKRESYLKELETNQESLQRENVGAQERAEQAYAALRELSRDMEALQQQQLKRHREMEDKRKGGTERRKRDAAQIEEMERELATLKSSQVGEGRDEGLERTCKDLRLKVFQLEAGCLKLEEAVRSEKTSKTLLMQRLKNREQKCRELERRLAEKQESAQEMKTSTAQQRKLEQQIKNKEDLVSGLNSALVQLQRSRSTEVADLQKEVMLLRKFEASRQANLTNLKNDDREALANTIHTQRKELKTLAKDLQESRMHQRVAEERAEQLALALKNKFRESDRIASLAAMDDTPEEQSRKTLADRLNKLTTLVGQQAPQILQALDSEEV
eukprot:m.197132 g.197132  ORF g.197132 m.197132 type:complete len:1105 (+) comp39539_c0_seq2:29-3343(+)